MKATELRAIQAPLKQRYRDEPDTAQIPARAEGTLEMDSVGCNVRMWAGDVETGLHPAGGGSGEQACSADMLLQALVGCAGVTFAAVATAMEIPIKSGRVIAEGTWDARGTLGVDRAAPIGVTDVKLVFEIDTDAEPKKVAQAVSLAERYCVVAQTLSNPPTITVSHNIV